jgi:hypothetical protein
VNFREQVDRIKQSIQMIGQQLSCPDDDWTNVLVVEGRAGTFICPIVFGDAADKVQFAAALPDFLRQREATFVALVLASWVREVPADDPALQETIKRLETQGVCNDPQRQEIVLLEVCDGANVEAWSAKITRYKDLPPQLGPWETWDVQGGRFAGLLQKSFPKARV